MGKARFAPVVGLLAAMAWGGSAQAVVIFQDSFESYANTTAMLSAGAWGDAGAGTAPATLEGSGGNPNKYLKHNADLSGGVSVKHNIPNVTPSDAQPLVWEFDFYDDGIGNKRVTGGLRNSGGSVILEMGRFNSINNPETGATVSGYGVRTVNLAGNPAGASGWVTYVGNPVAQVGWHHLKATIGATSILFELDFGANGTVDASRTITINGGSAVFNQLRLGGPSDVSSAGGGAGFDNVSLQQIPEPATLALLAIGSSLFLRRRTA